MDNTSNLGPAMGSGMNGGAQKSGGLMTAIVVIALVIVAGLLLMSKDRTQDPAVNEQAAEDVSPVMTAEEESAAELEATGSFSTSDELDSIEADLQAAEMAEFE